MFGALSAHPGLGVTGLNAKLPPRSSLPGISSPFSLTGEWQSPQRATCSTRYLPRSSCADLSCAAEEPGAEAITPIKIATNTAAAQVCFIGNVLSLIEWPSVTATPLQRFWRVAPTL